MERRAYALLTVKAVDEDERIIEGIASTPTPDRMGDIVEPLGAKFALPMPLLWQHRADSPVGHVEFAKPNKNGIPFRARIAKLTDPGALKDDVDKAWQAVKSGLVRGVSIGFRVLEHSIMKDGGWRISEWEWLELSVVTIPAQSEATITAIKSIDTALREQQGTPSPGVPGTSSRSLKTTKPGRGTMTTTERITSLEAVRDSKAARIEGISTACAEEDRTKTEQEREEFDGLVADIAAVDQEIADLKTQEAIQKRAVPVAGNGTEAASKSRDTSIRVAPRDNPEKGIQFARLAMAIWKADNHPGTAMEILKAHYPSHPAIPVLKAAASRGEKYDNFIAKAAEIRTKADVPAGSTSDETWAGPLLAHNTYTADFIEFLRPRTIIGRFGTDGIPSLRMIPFNVHIKGQTTGGQGYWVGEGQTKPVTRFDFFEAFHRFTKLAGISVLTEELVRFSDPAAEALVRDGLGDAVIEVMDTSFVDATAASNSRPAGLRNNVVEIPSNGSDIDGITEDVAALWADADGADLPQDSAVYIMRPTISRRLGLMRGELNSNLLFPEINARGGNLLGVPIITSNHAPAGKVMLVFASEIYLSDDGTVTVEASREASIQMVDAPSETTVASTDLDEDYPAPVHAELVSMFQTDSVALKAKRYIHWSKRRANAVQVLAGVEWGISGS